MKRPLRFVRLPAAERRLLVKAALLLVAIRLGLGLLPFQTLRHLLAQVAEAPAGFRGTNRYSTERIAQAVEVAGRHLPGAGTCLTQALAGTGMLRRRGIDATMTMGVAKAALPPGGIEAHAWLSCAGVILTGAGGHERFQVVTRFTGAPTWRPHAPGER